MLWLGKVHSFSLKHVTKGSTTQSIKLLEMGLVLVDSS